MKKIIYFISVYVCMISCTQPQNTTNTRQTETEPTTYKVINYQVIDVVDSIITLYPNLYVNDVQKDKFCKCLRKELDKRLKSDNAFLQEIPMQFSQMSKKSNGKYILKFECGQYTTNDKKLSSANHNTKINFAIFAEVNEDLASTLENNAKYKINGNYKGFVDGKLTLPSGNVFNYPTDCYKYSSNDDGTVCLGGFLFSNLQVEKTY